MQITINMLSARINELTDRMNRQILPQFRLQNTDGSKQIESAGIYAGSIPRRSRIYLLEEEQADNIPPKYPGVPFMICSKEDMAVMLETVNDVFDRYRAWIRNLENCSPDLPGISRMLENSKSVLGGTLLLVDNHFHQLAYTREYRQSGFIDDTNYGDIPLALARKMISDDAFNRLSTSREPVLYMLDEPRTATLCLNLFRENERTYYARLMLHTNDEQYTPVHSDMLLLLREYIHRILKNLSTYSLSVSVYAAMRSMIKGMLERKLPFPERAAEVLEDIHWKINDRFILSVIPAEPQGNSTTMRTVCNDLEFSLPHACAFIHNNEISVLVNLSRDDTDEYELKNILKNRLAPYRLQAGLSECFTDIMELPEAYRQAQSACRTGTFCNPEAAVFFFRDYIVDYILQGNQMQFPAEMLCHPAFDILRRYDREHESSLFDTLCVYLECRCNATHTAEKLYLHRTTFLRHLEKIIQLTGLEFDSPRTRFHLLYSYLVQ